MFLKNKISFVTIYEKWFECKTIENANGYKVFCYRNSFLNSKTPLFIKEKKYTLITDLTQDLDTIFSLFKKNTRNKINKVKKIESFSYSINQIDKEAFVDFYNQLAKAKKLPVMQISRFAKYGNRLHFFSAYLDGELTNVQVYLVDNENKIGRALYSVSTIHGLEDKEKRDRIGFINNYLHWESMKYLKEMGCSIYDWGGYGNDEKNKELAGIDRFKKSFGGEILEMYDYYSIPFYILDKIKYYFL